MKYPFREPSLALDLRVDDLVSRLTLDEKISMLTTWQKAVPRLGIGEWHIGAEVARGYVSRNPEKPTTVFPEPIGLAATFDSGLMEKLGEIAGREARILHAENPKTNLMLWGPTVDACRDPRWGRNEEGYGEDPFLTGALSKAYTLGMAGRDPKYMRTVPTLKHFFANNNEYRRGELHEHRAKLRKRRRRQALRPLLFGGSRPKLHRPRAFDFKNARRKDGRPNHRRNRGGQADGKGGVGE